MRLRLAAAGMTDVGRRRERNQDNTTHHVPSEERVLAEKGALFVVCDGMGGHAAGEVASELGVETIRETYYADTNRDLISSIANAIKTANERIFGYAREHAEMAGMGTTCVTLVVHGGRAYIVNIGDSRAYLVRNGAMRQVTLDHSWVAEQVRAGVLTEDQARTHAHRNVITRSLGTQPTVNADLFVETLRASDRILICSDGLHGYVDEAEIEREMVQHTDPEAAVRTLIDMANDNGGPDNITAVVVHLLEVPAVTGELTLPNMEEQGITQPIPAVRVDKRSAAPAANGPAAPVAPADKQHGARSRTRGSRLALASVRILAVAALIALVAGIWDFTYGPYGAYRTAVAQVQSDIAEAQRTVQAARGQDSQKALAALAGIHDRLTADTRLDHIDDQTRASAQTALAQTIAPAVRDALSAYNISAKISAIPVGLAQIYTVACPIAGGAPGATAPLATVTAFVAGTKSATSQTFYALAGQNLYQLTTPLTASGVAPGALTCAQWMLPTDLSVATIAADSSGLYLLGRQGSAYSVQAVAPDGANPDGSAKTKLTPRAALQLTASAAPTALAVSGDDAYVAYDDGAASGVLRISGQAPSAQPPNGQGPTGQPPKQTTTTLPLATSAKSLAAVGTDVYALAKSGSLAISHNGGAFVQPALTAPLPLTRDDPDGYAASTPVPVPVASSSAQTVAFGDAAALAVDPTISGGVFIGDGAHSRVVRLASDPSAGASLAQQYVYGHPLDDVSQFAFSASGPALNIYLWSGRHLYAVSLTRQAA